MFKESLPFSVGAMRWLVWFVSYGPFSSLLKSYAKNAEGEAYNEGIKKTIKAR